MTDDEGEAGLWGESPRRQPGHLVRGWERNRVVCSWEGAARIRRRQRPRSCGGASWPLPRRPQACCWSALSSNQPRATHRSQYLSGAEEPGDRRGGGQGEVKQKDQREEEGEELTSKGPFGCPLLRGLIKGGGERPRTSRGTQNEAFQAEPPRRKEGLRRREAGA